jgi:hypothetical protein
MANRSTYRPHFPLLLQQEVLDAADARASGEMRVPQN